MTEPLTLDVDRHAALAAEARARLAGDPSLAAKFMRDDQRYHIAMHLLNIATDRLLLEQQFPGRKVAEYQAMAEALKWQALSLYPGLYG